LLLEQDPHQLLEGMIIAAYAIQAHIAYIFLRGEYHVAALRLEMLCWKSVKGYLGEHVMNSISTWNLSTYQRRTLYLRRGNSAAQCAGGKRATPRAKPPFPLVSGFGQATVINNVETLCNVPHILHYAVEWYQGLARGVDKGTKLFGASDA